MEMLFGAVEPFMRAYGALALFALLALESLGLPLPGESALIVSGTLAARGEISLGAMFIAAWAGAVLGDNIGYGIGRLAGRPVIERFGGKVGLTAARFERVEAVFRRYGPAAVAGARFVNVLRQLNGIVAGTSGMDWRVFLVCNALGAALWVLAWGLGAWWLASHAVELKPLEQWAVHAESTLLPALALIITAAALLWRRRRPGRA